MRGLQRTEERLHAAFDHADHLADIAPVAVAAHLDAHPIAMHQALHFRRRQKYRVGECLGTHEAIAGAVGAQLPFRLHQHRLAVARIPPAAARAQVCRRIRLALAAGFRWPLLAATPQLTVPDPFRTLRRPPNAQVAELVDALVSGTSGATRGGSSPLLGTIQSKTYDEILQYRIK